MEYFPDRAGFIECLKMRGLGAVRISPSDDFKAAKARIISHIDDEGLNSEDFDIYTYKEGTIIISSKASDTELPPEQQEEEEDPADELFEAILETDYNER